MSNSTSLSDQPDLDAAFERSNRSEWEALATRSLRDGRTLPDLATVTLDGLRIEALHDSYGADKAPPPPLPRKALSHVDNVVRIVMGDTAALATELREALSGGADRLELVGTPSDERLQTILDQSHLQGVGLAFRIDSGDTGDGLDERVRARIESRGSHARPSKLALLRDPIGDAVAGTLAASDMEAAIQAAAQASLAPGNGLLADASAHHNAGASAVDELVASVMLWKSHVEALMAAGLDASAAATRVDVNLAIDANLPESVAKLRALRSLLVDTGSALGLDDTQVPSIITAETSGRFLSRLDPWNNHLRNVLAASAAIISGASRVTVLPHDRLDGATPTARRVARNTAVILLRESHLADANDAAAGSYAIESLTAAMVTGAKARIEKKRNSTSCTKTTSMEPGPVGLQPRRRSAKPGSAVATP